MKKIIALALVIAALFSMTAWAETLPVFDSLLDARDYLNEQVLSCPESISFRLARPEEFDEKDFLVRARSIGGQFSVDGEISGDVVTLNYNYYPGMRIYHAIQIGDARGLTDDELTAAQIAGQVAADAMRHSNTAFDLTLYLHDWLCENVTYESMPTEYDEMPRVCGAVGALVDGRANCQGYSDAFRLLGLLAGLNVRKQEGMDGDGGMHDWNVIALGGKWLIVDVTHDDPENLSSYCHAYLNAGRDVAVHSWNENAACADVAAFTDPDFWFYTRNNRVYDDVDSLASAAYFARRDDHIELYEGMVRASGLTWEDLSGALLRIADERGKKCSWHIDCFSRGSYTYFTVRWTKW